LGLALKKLPLTNVKSQRQFLTNKQKTTFIFIEGFTIAIKKALLDGLPKGLIVEL